MVSVIANLNKANIESQRVIQALETQFIPQLLARYPGLQYGLAGETHENKMSMNEIKKGIVLALLLIYAMMAIPLKSYIQPLAIMAAMPFGIVGAIWGHLFIGLPVSILSLCGIIALAGVVVNDSLIMLVLIPTRCVSGTILMRRWRTIFGHYPDMFDGI